MFSALKAICARPKPFEFYTAGDLWTDAHTSKQMLAFHLNKDIDVSSRNLTFIRRSVQWIGSYFKVRSGLKIIDFGCGPGLYTTALAQKGADVTGLDFSATSIQYARDTAVREKLKVNYIHRNYLEFDTDRRFDLVLMIMCDFCALGPLQRKHILKTFFNILTPRGRVLLDIFSLSAFGQRKEETSYAKNLLDGFWSPNTYYGFRNTFKYNKEKVVLDKFTIVESERIRTIYNWMQYFSPEVLSKEFANSGFAVKALYADVAGTPFSSKSGEFAIVAQKLRE